MKQALSMCAQAVTTYIVAVVFSFLAMGVNALWLQATIGIALLALTAFLMYMDGMRRGERACNTAEIVENQMREGRAVDARTRAAMFQKTVAWTGYLMAVAVFLLIATVNLIAEPFYPPVYGVDAEEVAESETVASESVPTQVNPFSVAARIAFLPVSFLYRVYARDPHSLNLWFLALALWIPAPEFLGYLRGPAAHAKLVSDIQKGKRKKARNLKVHKAPRPPRSPKMEV